MARVAHRKFFKVSRPLPSIYAYIQRTVIRQRLQLSMPCGLGFLPLVSTDFPLLRYGFRSRADLQRDS